MPTTDSLLTSGNGDDFFAWMQSVQVRSEQALALMLPSPDCLPARLHHAMAYTALGGGKRVRPLLVYAAGDLVKAPDEWLDRAACAVEMIHAYSLVHDDLPCMDNDSLRRGRPTCHIQYDEATALLVGDALQTRAFEVLSDPVLADPGRQIQLVRLLASASGSLGMAGGQAMDLAAVGMSLTLAELEQMHRMKTGALIRSAVLMGIWAGSTPPDETLTRALDIFSQRLGLLFQVVDDILDRTATTAELGKTAGKDAEQHKPTYVSLLGLEAAQHLSQQLHSEAVSSLAPFGERAGRLQQLADYVLSRRS